MSNPSHTDAEYQLPIEPFKGTPEEIERQWYERCYKGRGDSMLQLTLRAVIMGSLLGGILSLTNLYIGLKSGWGFGVAITACILSYSIWTGLRFVTGGWLTPMTILENNCMQSCASSAGYSTGGTLVSAIAAYVLIHHGSPNVWVLLGWVFFLAILGTTMAIPMKRQMINVEQLRFPSGIAAAETLRALHTTGGTGIQSSIALGVAGLVSAANKFWTEGLTLISSGLASVSGEAFFERLNAAIFPKAAIDRTVAISWQPMFIAAGAITGLPVCTAMLLGGALCWFVYVPWLQQQGILQSTELKDMLNYTLWGGASCMVTSGLLSFGLQWKSALRAFKDLSGMFTFRKRAADDPIGAIETPASWFVIGQIIGTIGLAWLGKEAFGMPYWLTVVAVLLSFALALVACRVCGETDSTPVGAMGKVTQLTFGAIYPGSMNVNLMSACVTAGAADSSSDLLTDLKSGYLLGAHPRRQFLAQFSGIFIGTVVSVLSFQAVVRDGSILGGREFPAPAAQTWRAVAVALGEGLQNLESVKVWSIVIGGLIGLILPTIATLLPQKKARWVPSAAGLGLAWTFGFDYCMLFFAGAVIGEFLKRAAPKTHEQYLFPVASGIIAGESLMGVAIIFTGEGRAMWQQFFGG